MLPADASRAEVVRVMRGFASALGVRCNHCHVGENSANLDNYDFAADTKAPKRAARAMMQMTPSSEYFKKRLSEFKQEK